ncbi:hypothetical protein [Planococcus koreensis]|uniref:hypothetical protein n=1 Tax=Planococcus koreensis TaxID=112331 RepID=UPI0039FC4A3A
MEVILEMKTGVFFGIDCVGKTIGKQTSFGTLSSLATSKQVDLAKMFTSSVFEKWKG